MSGLIQGYFQTQRGPIIKRADMHFVFRAFALGGDNQLVAPIYRFRMVPPDAVLFVNGTCARCAQRYTMSDILTVDDESDRRRRENCLALPVHRPCQLT